MLCFIMFIIGKTQRSYDKSSVCLVLYLKIIHRSLGMKSRSISDCYLAEPLHVMHRPEHCCRLECSPKTSSDLWSFRQIYT